ncbi:hypothetical protein MAR_031491, partial [Mya arenaria]
MATRFGLSTQSTSVVFNAWILGQLSIWPHRDTIIKKNMPEDYRNDFPPFPRWYRGENSNTQCTVITKSTV